MVKLQERKQEIEAKLKELDQKAGEVNKFIETSSNEVLQLQGRYEELSKFEENNSENADEKAKDLLIHCSNRKKDIEEKFNTKISEINEAQQELKNLQAQAIKLQGSYDELLELENINKQDESISDESVCDDKNE